MSYADPAVTNVYCKSIGEVANDFYAAIKELYQIPTDVSKNSASAQVKILSFSDKVTQGSMLQLLP